MKGRILDHNPKSQQGLIAAEDGNSYMFVDSQWQADCLPEPGTEVEFTASRQDALNVGLWQAKPSPGLGRWWFLPAQYLLLVLAALGVKRLFQQKPRRMTAVALALLFGSLGIHKVYLGRFRPVLILLIAAVCLGWLWGPMAIILLLAVSGLISWIELLLYLSKTDAEFEQIYLNRHKAWF